MVGYITSVNGLSIKLQPPAATWAGGRCPVPKTEGRGPSHRRGRRSFRRRFRLDTVKKRKRQRRGRRLDFGSGVPNRPWLLPTADARTRKQTARSGSLIFENLGSKGIATLLCAVDFKMNNMKGKLGTLFFEKSQARATILCT